MADGSNRRSLKAYLRPTTMPVVVAILVALCAGVFADRQNLEIHRQQLRGEVLHEVGLIRARLEGSINGNIQLVRGLVATIATEPDMDQQRFAALAGHLLEEHSQIRNVAGAPDLVVRLIYPLEGNEQAIGLDYRSIREQRDSVFRARESGELVLAGPVDLIQGGQGFIARFPVRTPQTDGSSRFWGIVSAVIDLDRLYRDNGVVDPRLPIEIAIAGRDGIASHDALPFFGDAAIIDDDPVTADVMLPAGAWRIYARPDVGWEQPAPNRWTLRALMLCAGIIVILPILLTGGLIEERQKHIAQLRQRETELERLSRRLHLALGTSRLGVWEYSVSNDVLIWDERMNELYGYRADGGQRGYGHWLRRLHGEDRERAEKDLEAAIDRRANYNSEYRLQLDDGGIRHIRALGTFFDDIDGTSKMVGINWDVTEEVLRADDLRRANMLTEAHNAQLLIAKARIEHTALHDSLTSLPNRRYLDQMLETRAQAAPDSSQRTALLHIDLDRFKQINDTLGHAAGDAMLVHASRILRGNVRASDFIARVGGDEFVVLCALRGDDPERDAGYLAALANRIIRQMREPVMFEGHECRFGVSVGIAVESDDAADPRRLLVNADIALYRAKSRGRNRHQFFNEALQAEIVTSKRVADEILTGLEQGQFIVHYQPQFDAETLEVTGVEALARWNHPAEGLLGPDSFLKVAEELNVVSVIDRMVLEQAVNDLKLWERAGIEIPKVSVNVSARRLNDEELVDGLRRLDFRPGTIAFELVESIFLDGNDDVIGRHVEMVKQLGIDIEIDDFGTGYASIVSLLKLKPQRLKIDRQLVVPITGSSAQRHLVESIIDIGRSLGIGVTAEGVETMEHARLLRQLGCGALQGYAFARPMAADDLAAFVRARTWRAA